MFFKNKKIKNSKIYVGCGSDSIEGYVGCDIRRLPTVDIVCKAWELDRFAINAKEIYSRHMVEHLTLAEMMKTVEVWYKCLDQNGKIVMLTPDMDFHVQQYLKAQWTDEEWEDPRGNACHSFAGFWGFQRDTESFLSRTTSNIYWDVHKSGYNKDSMAFFLRKILPKNAKVDIKVIDEMHLHTTILKMN